MPLNDAFNMVIQLIDVVAGAIPLPAASQALQTARLWRWPSLDDNPAMSCVVIVSALAVVGLRMPVLLQAAYRNAVSRAVDWVRIRTAVLTVERCWWLLFAQLVNELERANSIAKSIGF